MRRLCFDFSLDGLGRCSLALAGDRLVFRFAALLDHRLLLRAIKIFVFAICAPQTLTWGRLLHRRNLFFLVRVVQNNDRQLLSCSTHRLLCNQRPK